MERLTRERTNGIKQGYWSSSTKEEVVQRLAEYENTGLTPQEIMDGKLLTGWIPVSERLPEPIGLNEDADVVIPVLITYKSHLNDYPMCDCDAIYCKDGMWRWFNHNHRVYGMEVIAVEVTAWMPRPEPYWGGK